MIALDLTKIGLQQIIPFSLRIYRNKIFFFPFLFKIKLYRSDAMLEFSFSIKEKSLIFFTVNSKVKWYNSNV